MADERKQPVLAVDSEKLKEITEAVAAAVVSAVRSLPAGKPSWLSIAAAVATVILGIIAAFEKAKDAVPPAPPIVQSQSLPPTVIVNVPPTGHYAPAVTAKP